MSENTNKQETVFVDNALNPVPLDQRQHWLTPAMIFAGLEFCIPVIMIGSLLIGSFSLVKVAMMVVFSLVVFTFPGNTLSAYIGAKTGLASSVAAKSSFGEKQARYIVALIITLVGIGHWGMQTAITGNAICAALGIDYLTNRVMWGVVTVICGLLFCIPSVIGYNAMKWTDYVAVPAGLLLCFVGVYLSLKTVGAAGMFAYQPVAPSMSTLGAINLLISLNTATLVLTMDYSRFAKARLGDSMGIAMGIVGVGIPLILIGAIMGVTGSSADIVQVMIGLGFPFWGFLVLWLSTWTSQLVNNYSAGLSLANIFNIRSSKGRMLATITATGLAILVALTGVLDHIADIYYLTGLFFPAMGGIMFTDFFMKKKHFIVSEQWNWVATLSLVAGFSLGYVTQYVLPIGLPAVQSFLISVVIYYVGMKAKVERILQQELSVNR